MRILAVLLLSTCFASSAYAEVDLSKLLSSVSDGSNASSADASKGAAVPVAIPPVVNGKFTVGYEGRGDYIRNDKLERHLAVPPLDPNAANKPNVPPGTIVLDGKSKSAAAVAAAVAAATPAPVAAAPATPTMLSDSGLRSDAVKPQASTQASSMGNTQQTILPPSTSPGNGQNNNPMLLVSGGKVLSQH